MSAHLLQQKELIVRYEVLVLPKDITSVEANSNQILDRKITSDGRLRASFKWKNISKNLRQKEDTAGLGRDNWALEG